MLDNGNTIFDAWKEAKVNAGYGNSSDSDFAAHLLSFEYRRSLTSKTFCVWFPYVPLPYHIYYGVYLRAEVRNSQEENDETTPARTGSCRYGCLIYQYIENTLRYTCITGIIFSAYRYWKFLISNIPSCRRQEICIHFRHVVNTISQYRE